MQEELLAPASLTITASSLRRDVAARRALGCCLLFLVVWLSYGVLIQDKNQRDYGLQQMGVEAIVERGHCYLEGSPTPQLQPIGDVFDCGGHLYAAKQPGQFIVGALAYLLLHLLGLAYLKQFTLTAALVTFWTASLVTAGSALAVFDLARRLASPRTSIFWPLGIALAFALGTTALPYAGIAHHDTLASGYLVFAFWCLCGLPRTPDAPGRMWRTAGAGFFLGLTVTTSMLPFFMAVAMALSFLTLRQWRLMPCFLASGALGLLPLLVYDTVSFGNPFLLPNVAGHFADTFFAFEWGHCADRAHFYVNMLTLYAPICWCGLTGLAVFPRSLRREQGMLLALLAALAGYILNIQTAGDSQYGPRYLLPAMPFMALGLIGITHLRPRPGRWMTGGLLLIGLCSAGINLLGAIGGAQYGEVWEFAVPRYLWAIQAGRLPAFPLAASLAPPLALCSVGLMLWSYRQRRAPIMPPKRVLSPAFTLASAPRLTAAPSSPYNGVLCSDGSRPSRTPPTKSAPR